MPYLIPNCFSWNPAEEKRKQARDGPKMIGTGRAHHVAPQLDEGSRQHLNILCVYDTAKRAVVFVNYLSRKRPVCARHWEAGEYYYTPTLRSAPSFLLLRM